MDFSLDIRAYVPTINIRFVLVLKNCKSGTLFIGGAAYLIFHTDGDTG